MIRLSFIARIRQLNMGTYSRHGGSNDADVSPIEAPSMLKVIDA